MDVRRHGPLYLLLTPVFIPAKLSLAALMIYSGFNFGIMVVTWSAFYAAITLRSLPASEVERAKLAANRQGG